MSASRYRGQEQQRAGRKVWLDWMMALRPINLLMVLVTQLLSWTLIASLIEPVAAPWLRLLITGATVLICGGGNLINDWYDREIDAINRPAKSWVGVSASPGAVYGASMLMLGSGSVLGLVAGLMLNTWKAALLIPAAAWMLVVYSRELQHRAAWGNLVVSLLIVLTVLLPALMEPSITLQLGPASYAAGSLIWSLLMHFSAMAFLANMLREIAKDIEDSAGDRAFGGQTFGMEKGARGVKPWLYVLVVLQLPLAASLVLSYPSFAGWGLLLFVPSAIWLLTSIRTAQEEVHFSQVSRRAKVFQLAGMIWFGLFALFAASMLPS